MHIGGNIINIHRDELDYHIYEGFVLDFVVYVGRPSYLQFMATHLIQHYFAALDVYSTATYVIPSRLMTFTTSHGVDRG